MPRLTRDLAFVLFPKLYNGSATFGLNIYAFHHLAVGEYGVASFCLTSLQVMDGLFGSAFDVAVTRKLHEKPDDPIPDSITAIERTAIVSKLLIGFIFTIILLLTGEAIANKLFHRSGDGLTLSAVVAAATCILLVRSIQLAFQLRFQFLPYGFADIVQTTLRILLVVIGFASGSASALWLISSFGFAGLITALLFFQFAKHTGLSNWTGGPLLMRELWDRCKTLLLTSGLGSVLNRLDMVILGIVSNTRELGMFGAALAIAIIPEILATYTSPVLLPRILPSRTEGTLKKLFLSVNSLFYASALIALLFVWLVPDSLFFLIFPTRYADSIGVLRFLLPGLLASASLLPLSLNLLLLTKPRIMLYIDLATAPLLIGSYFFFGEAYGAIGVAFSLTVVRILKMIAAQIFAWRSIPSDSL